MFTVGLVCAPPAAASHGPNVFSGTWATNIGGVSFKVVSGASGAPALKGLAGHPCAAPTVYYRGAYHDSFHTGTIIACTVGKGRIAGRYVANGSTSDHGDGGIGITFAAPNRFSGSYTGDDFPGMTFPYTGSFQNHFSGDGCCAAPKKKKKKKKKKVGGCPVASKSSAGARAAYSCHWYVNFSVTQKGDPSRSYPKPRVGFVDGETAAVGKVFFNAKPKSGRTSVGRAAAVIAHTDTYQSALNPFTFDEGEVKLAPLTAKYSRRSGEARIELIAVVSSVAGVPYAQDYDEIGLAGGDKALVTLVAEPPHDDRLTLDMRCGGCKGSTILEGSHYHRFLEGPADKLRIEISAPKPL
jgi:hypothetical protein